jgi:hypothetical protein
MSFTIFRQLGDPQGVWRTTFGNGHSRSEDRTLLNNLPSVDTDSVRREVKWVFRPSQR